ncbi:MAG TPA: hypothetical protein VFH83_14690 [Spirochaetia bacterium]|nr:hypothetical protein [Spirochaetia bacterium]
MRKTVLAACVAALLVFGTAGAFAAGEVKSTTFPWMASFDQPGQLNLNVSAGFYGLGIDVNVGPEFIIGKFDIAGIPLSWGATVRGLVGFSSFFGVSWIDWAAAPMVTLHWGVDFGAPWKFDWYVGAGLSISGTTGTYYSTLGLAQGAVGFGFASADGVAWHFSNNIALLAEYAYTPYVSTAGVGVKFAL